MAASSMAQYVRVKTQELRNHLVSIAYDPYHESLSEMSEQRYNQICNKIREACRLISQGANPDVADANGFSALHFVSILGNEELCLNLIKKGANVNFRDEGDNCLQQTPLHLAAEYGRSRIIEVLVAAGAEIDIRDYYAQTPLLIAAQNIQTEAMIALLKAGANAHDKQTKMLPLNGLIFRVVSLFEEERAVDKACCAIRTLFQSRLLDDECQRYMRRFARKMKVRALFTTIYKEREKYKIEVQQEKQA